MLFSKDFLQAIVQEPVGEPIVIEELSFDEEGPLPFPHGTLVEVMLDDITTTSRWSIHYRLVFRVADHFYETSYSRGATEYQDESPFEYIEDGEVEECPEVFPVEKMTIVYKEKKEA